jgi:RNA polymerase sigma factor (sigma-70 family)
MLTDAVLVDRVIAGFEDAFDELYRRHANAAWRVAQAVAGNSHDAADAVSEAFARVLQAVKAGRLDNGEAFRSYLLAATRNSALDAIRRAGRSRPSEHIDLDAPATGASPVEVVTGGEDAAIVAEAFRNLPERWRSVLWLTEVEGIPTKEAAEQLGLTANGTAQLAVRARAGLRDRYLQAHVRNHAKPECRFTVDHLGAYVGGGISPRDLAKVDQHLAACEDCRARKAELEDMGTTLRRIVLPLPLGLAAASALKAESALAATATTATTGAATTASSGMAKVVQLAKDPSPGFKKFVGAAAAGVLTLGIASIGFLNHDAGTAAKGLAAPRTATIAPSSALLPDALVPISDSAASSDLARSDGLGDFGTSSGDQTGAVPGTTTGGGNGSGSNPTGTNPLPHDTNPGSPTCATQALLCPPPPPDLPGAPTVGLGVNLNGTPIGADVTVNPTSPTDSTVGANVGGTEVLAGAPTPTDPNTAQITAPVVGTVTLP